MGAFIYLSNFLATLLLTGGGGRFSCLEVAVPHGSQTKTLPSIDVFFFAGNEFRQHEIIRILNNFVITGQKVIMFCCSSIPTDKNNVE